MPANLAQQAQEIANRLRGGVGRRKDAELRAYVEEYLEDEGTEKSDPDFGPLVEATVILLGGARQNPVPPSQPLEQANAGAAAAPDDCTGPFRFAGISEHVAPAPQGVRTPANDRPLQGGFSGRIDVEWACETPVLIGDYSAGGDIATPFKLGNDYAIPGATLRGMLRAEMEIVCRARLTQANKHHKYGIRDFKHKLFTEEDEDGKKLLAWDNLKAGWLQKAGPNAPEQGELDSEYVITPCDKYMTPIRSLPERFNGNKPTGNSVWHRTWLATELRDRYKLAGMEERGIINFEKTGTFKIEDGCAIPDPGNLRDQLRAYSYFPVTPLPQSRKRIKISVI